MTATNNRRPTRDELKRDRRIREAVHARLAAVDLLADLDVGELLEARGAVIAGGGRPDLVDEELARRGEVPS